MVWRMPRGRSREMLLRTSWRMPRTMFWEMPLGMVRRLPLAVLQAKFHRMHWAVFLGNAKGNSLVNALSGNNSRKAFGNGSETNLGIPQGTLWRMSSGHSCLGLRAVI